MSSLLTLLLPCLLVHDGSVAFLKSEAEANPYYEKQHMLERQASWHTCLSSQNLGGEGLEAGGLISSRATLSA